MRPRLFWVLCLVALLLTGAVYAQEATPQLEAEPTETYIVQPGDTLFRIAVRFGLTTQELAAANGITNPALIFVGQELSIPAGGEAPEPTATPAPTITPNPTATAAPSATPAPAPTDGTTYIVQSGDSLYRIAIRNNTTVTALLEANNLTNRDLIFTGQRLIIPGGSTAPAASPTSSPTASAPLTSTATDPGFAYGMIVYPENQNPAVLTDQLSDLAMDWARVRVNWRSLELVEGQINFTTLDPIIEAFDTAGLQLLLTVTNAPDWARETTLEEGPPQDLTTYANFIGQLAERYAGVVDAYQVWYEPNIRANWSCERPNATPPVRICNEIDYLEMLELAYDAVKAADPAALVITAGLAATGFNDNLNGISDRLYLETLYATGVADISDAIGIHPGGWANPPDAICCTAPAGVTTHYEAPVFYFLDNIEAYRQIIERYGDEDTALWVTQFGWGTSEDTGALDSQVDSASLYTLYSFVNFTSLAEQATYIPRAYELGENLGYIGPMFLDNLNGCQVAPGKTRLCFNSLISPTGSPRPVFSALANR